MNMLSRLLLWGALALAASGLAPSPAQAQRVSVVSSCGTVPQVLAAGSVGIMTVDQTGILCTTAGGGGGGGGAVTIANGAAVPIGATTDSAYVSGNGTEIAILKGIFGQTAGLATAANQTTLNGAVSTSALQTTLNGLVATAANQLLANAPVTPGAATATKAHLAACQYVAAGVTFTDGQQGMVSCDASGNIKVVSVTAGNVASGATDSGNPVKMGCVFNTTAPTVTNGQRVDWQCDNRGDGSVALVGASIAQSDAVSNTLNTLADRAGSGVYQRMLPFVLNPAGTWDRQRVGPYQLAQTPITASATGTTGATTATLAGVSTKTTYICGFTISADATAALAGSATVTGTISGSLNYVQSVGSATASAILAQTFSPCIPASATNTGIAVNSVAAGTGGNTAVSAWGFQQ